MDWAGSSTYPGMAYDVTIHIEDLEGVDTTEFLMCRSDDENRFALVDTTVIMVNGEMTVTVEPLELLTFRPSYDQATKGSQFPPNRLEYDTRGPLGNCGPGVGLSFLPPLAIRCFSLARRRRKPRKAKRA